MPTPDSFRSPDSHDSEDDLLRHFSVDSPDDLEDLESIAVEHGDVALAMDAYRLQHGHGVSPLDHCLQHDDDMLSFYIERLHPTYITQWISSKAWTPPLASRFLHAWHRCHLMSASVPHSALHQAMIAAVPPSDMSCVIRCIFEAYIRETSTFSYRTPRRPRLGVVLFVRAVLEIRPDLEACARRFFLLTRKHMPSAHMDVYLYALWGDGDKDSWEHDMTRILSRVTDNT